jgi:hypothetical protein
MQLSARTHTQRRAVPWLAGAQQYGGTNSMRICSSNNTHAADSASSACGLFLQALPFAAKALCVHAEHLQLVCCWRTAARGRWAMCQPVRAGCCARMVSPLQLAGAGTVFPSECEARTHVEAGGGWQPSKPRSAVGSCARVLSTVQLLQPAVRVNRRRVELQQLVRARGCCAHVQRCAGAVAVRCRCSVWLAQYGSTQQRPGWVLFVRVYLRCANSAAPFFAAVRQWLVCAASELLLLSLQLQAVCTQFTVVSFRATAVLYVCHSTIQVDGPGPLSAKLGVRLSYRCACWRISFLLLSVLEW